MKNIELGGHERKKSKPPAGDSPVAPLSLKLGHLQGLELLRLVPHTGHLTHIPGTSPTHWASHISPTRWASHPRAGHLTHALGISRTHRASHAHAGNTTTARLFKPSNNMEILFFFSCNHHENRKFCLFGWFWVEFVFHCLILGVWRQNLL